MLAGDVLVVADRAQHPAKRRTRQALQQDECHCEHRQDDAQEALLEHLWRDDAAPGAGDAVGAVGQPDPVGCRDAD